MFTGIIEELGLIKNIKSNSQAMQLTIVAKDVLKDVKLGDSIALNGVCLTVTSYSENEFTVDVMPETYKATSLSKLRINDKINLESSLRFNGKLGGHFVTGHVDGTGIIKQIDKIENAVNYIIEVENKLIEYFIYKGSVAIDGTSLTIFGIGENWIKISLIPHTVTHSIIGSKIVGDIVNIEADMLGKYILNLAKKNNICSKTSGITMDILKENGFINNV